MRNEAEKNSLCILIPTYNRSDTVNYYLEHKLDEFKKHHFDVIIYDSSSNHYTENITQKYINMGYSFLKYVYYEDPADDLYGTQKVRDALVECAENYEYVWLCGDTTMLLLEEYQCELFKLLEHKYDVIHIYPNNHGIRSQNDMDYKLFLEQFYWSMTHWCSFILSKRIIREMNKWMTKYLAMHYVSVVVFAVFASLAEENFKIAYINKDVYKYTPFRTTATSYVKKDILRGYAEVINVGINNLPREYDEVKHIAKKGFSANTGLFSWQGAVDLRADGNLTMKQMQKYGKHLSQVTDVPVGWYYFWSMIPQKIAMKLSNSYDVTVKGNEKLNELNEKEKRLILYGTGAHGASILEKIKYLYTKIQVTAISDKNWMDISSAYCVISPEEIPEYEYDYIAIAIVNKKIYKEVKKTFVKSGIPEKQIFHV